MKVNREQIIKALECCYDNNSSCIDCPFQATDKYVECSDLTNSALALIKELTEENERLSQSLANSKLILANYKADTVRKMLDRITEHATNGYPRKVRLDVIDQIAKEMLEGVENE